MVGRSSKNQLLKTMFGVATVPTQISDMAELAAVIVPALLAAYLVVKNASVIGRFIAKGVSSITGGKV